MKHLLLTIILAIMSCSKHESKDTIEPYDNVKEIAASYMEQMEGLSVETLFPDRCDRLTFISLDSAFVSGRDVSGYEWQAGQWHRDTYSCFPDNSRSEISFDGLIGVLHHAWTKRDFDLLVRIKDYGAANNWKMGEGPDEYTRLPQLAIILADMLDERPLTVSLSESTHKEHLLSLSLWLKLRYEGFLSSTEKAALEALPEHPLKEALVQRIKDGSQGKTISYLSKFPEKLPLETGIEDWGSAPSWLYFFLLKAVIDGK